MGPLPLVRPNLLSPSYIHTTTLINKMAWITPKPSPLPLFSTTAKHDRQTCTRARMQATPSQPLTAEEKQIAVSALRASQLLFQNAAPVDPPQLATSDLLAYCCIKGLRAHTNLWNRRVLLQSARQYQSEETLSRTRSGPVWENLAQSQKLRLLHDVCNAEGDATYEDPESGYTVFSAFAHLRRGHCCGVVVQDSGTVGRTHRCRHCPYTNNGELRGAHLLAFKERLHVIDFVRQNLQNDWRTLDIRPSESRPEEEPYQFSNDTFESIAGDRQNKQRLRRKLVKRVTVEKPDNAIASCANCGGERMTTCTRCMGWTHVFTPVIKECPQCNGEGMHPCMQCTMFRPPPSTSIYSS